MSDQEKALQQKQVRNKANQSKLTTDILQLKTQTFKDNVNAIARKQKELERLEIEEKGIRQQIEKIQSGKVTEAKNIDTVQSDLGKDYGTRKQQNNNAIENLNKQILELDTLYRNKVKYYSDMSIQYNGFMARLEALSRLSYKTDTIYDSSYSLLPNKVNISDSSSNAEAKIESAQTKIIKNINENKSVVWYAKWMLTLLLIAIEITPILFKMMTESGPYDDRVEEINYKSLVDKKKYISDINQSVNTDLKISQEINEQKLHAELQANKELLQIIASAQAEIIAVAIEKWKETEIERARRTPEDFVKSSAKVQNGG